MGPLCQPRTPTPARTSRFTFRKQPASQALRWKASLGFGLLNRSACASAGLWCAHPFPDTHSPCTPQRTHPIRLLRRAVPLCVPALPPPPHALSPLQSLLSPATQPGSGHSPEGLPPWCVQVQISFGSRFPAGPTLPFAPALHGIESPPCFHTGATPVHNPSCENTCL